jgi:hypothetical protein
MRRLVAMRIPTASQNTAVSALNSTNPASMFLLHDRIFPIRKRLPFREAT